ncbi:hypothetical protein RFI_05661 [Reticulomyxa filosa]|uniref:Uncharacterized protein n=1 Tax=Reticulomyxa filosa TaxID=46433 RepID=X6NYT1_RETFI|nr:hypothetical protein RFI_05661 [Reticulomyxa filosa]|eukprot:ETO31460.1 hypothetical protein RFI_05661 [Reticulomyxa filosa]
MLPHEMPLLRDKNGKLLPLAHEFFVLLKKIIFQPTFVYFFHKNTLLQDLIDLCCKDDSNVHYSWLPSNIRLLESNSSVQYDLLFELIRKLLESHKKRRTKETKKEDSDKNEDTSPANEEENKYNDNEADGYPNESDSKKTDKESDIYARAIANMRSKTFLQCLIARNCKNDEHQLKLVHFVAENDVTVSKKITEYAMRRIEHLDYYDCWSAVRCVMELMSIEDEYKQKRLSKCFKIFIQGVKREQSWHIVEMCIVLLVDLMEKKKEVLYRAVIYFCLFVAEWFLNSTDGIEFLNWIKTYTEKFPSINKISEIIKKGGNTPMKFKHEPLPQVDRSLRVHELPIYKNKKLKDIVQNFTTFLKVKAK